MLDVGKYVHANLSVILIGEWQKLVPEPECGFKIIK